MTQATKDALADAETLRGVAGDCQQTLEGWPTFLELMRAARNGYNAAAEAGTYASAAYNASDAARAAFRAVPGLRG